MPGPTAIIEARAVKKSYGSGPGRVEVLRGVGLPVAAGEVVALTGPSGSGKSTLLHILAGLTPPTSGSVRVCGEELAGLGDDARCLLRRRRVGLVFQAFHLIDVLTAEENVALPLSLAGVRPREAAARAARALAAVGLGDRRGRRPDELSGGEQQRVAVARALAAEPDLLLADEPTGNLDSLSGRRVLDLLRGVSGRRGPALLLATHDPGCAALADREVRLRDGRLYGPGAAEAA
jgi:putative ABC transport system ATP-binding protein